MDLLCSDLMNYTGNSWYAFRKPDSEIVCYGTGIAVAGLHPGFVVAPFDLTKNRDSLFTIVSDESWSENKSGYTQIIKPLPFPDRSTTRHEHSDEIKHIQDVIRQIGYGKIIASRTLLINKELNIAELFNKLLAAYPTAYIFACYTPATGVLFGATPERLLSSEKLKLHTMALAGTRPKTVDSEPWDEKNIQEQQMVSQFIIETFKNHSLNPVCEATYTKNAGNIEHICTPFHADITKQTFQDESKFMDFLSDLSPTPALSGLPRDVAMQTIYNCESYNRGYYGGFVGYYQSPLEFDFFVNLRSGRYKDQTIALYAGGGITLLSDCTAEWNETESKLSTLLQFL